MTTSIQNQPPTARRTAAQFITNIFWNDAHKRLRAGWRILVQLIIVAALVGITSLAWVFFFEYLAKSGLGTSLAVNLVMQIINFGLTSISILAGLALTGRFVDHRPFKAFGFALDRRWWIDFGFGLALGGILMTLIFGVEFALGWVTISGTWQTSSSSFAAGFLAYIALFIAVGIQEETMARGYWLRNIAEGLNFRRVGPGLALLTAYAISSLIFGLLHLMNPNASLISTVNLILAGLLLGLPYVLTGELAIPIGLHITWNFFQGTIFGFPVSGGAPNTTLIAIQQGGPELWTGGAFGPEAGLIGVIAMLIGAGLIVGWLKLTQGRLAWRRELAIYTPYVSAEQVHNDV